MARRIQDSPLKFLLTYGRGLPSDSLLGNPKKPVVVKSPEAKNPKSFSGLLQSSVSPERDRTDHFRPLISLRDTRYFPKKKNRIVRAVNALLGVIGISLVILGAMVKYFEQHMPKSLAPAMPPDMPSSPNRPENVISSPDAKPAPGVITTPPATITTPAVAPVKMPIADKPIQFAKPMPAIHNPVAGLSFDEPGHNVPYAELVAASEAESRRHKKATRPVVARTDNSPKVETKPQP